LGSFLTRQESRHGQPSVIAVFGNKNMKLLILPFILFTAAAYAADETITIFSTAYPQPGGPDLITRVSLSHKVFDRLPRINPLKDKLPLSIDDAISLATTELETKDPNLKGSYPKECRVTFAKSTNPNNDFPAVPVYAITLNAFVEKEEDITSYDITFVVLPDKSVHTPTIEQ
jgi:hypothetical protein